MIEDNTMDEMPELGVVGVVVVLALLIAVCCAVGCQWLIGLI
jgi:hypothetical protein